MNADWEVLIAFILFFILLIVSIWVVIVHGWAGLIFVAIVIVLFIFGVALLT